MIAMLARRTLGDRPRRTAILLLGLGIAVGVMITLLAIGDAVLVQARDKDLVGGGDLLLLPAGLELEVMKMGGATGIYTMLDNARFLFRRVLSGPRFAAALAPVTLDGAPLPVAAASPALAEKLVYVRRVGSRGTAPLEALAHGFIPSLDIAAGGPTAAFASQGIPWRDSGADRMWMDPPVDSLYNAMDRFHLPPRELPDLDRWGEWLYFNFTDPGSGAFGYLSFIAGGDIEAGSGRAGPLLHVHRSGEPRLELKAEAPIRPEDLSKRGVDLRLAERTTVCFRDGAYKLHLEWDGARGSVRGDLVVRPFLDLDYPPFLIHESERFISGYAVPALRTHTSGTIRAPGLELVLRDAPGYHDHNWGTWRSVSWEWGTASTDTFALLYGRVRHPELDPGRAGAGVFVLLSQARTPAARGGNLGLFRPQQVDYEWRDAGDLPGDPARVPVRIAFRAVQESPSSTAATMGSVAAPDRIEVQILVLDVAATPQREEDLVFLQLHGRYDVRARVAGREIGFAAPGFAEVFVPPRADGSGDVPATDPSR
jgi:hypothetical protein